MCSVHLFVYNYIGNYDYIFYIISSWNLQIDKGNIESLMRLYFFGFRQRKIGFRQWFSSSLKIGFRQAKIGFRQHKFKKNEQNFSELTLERLNALPY